MNTKKMIVDLNKHCDELEQSDCHGKSEAIEHIKAAMAAIKKPKPDSGAFDAENIKLVECEKSKIQPRYLAPRHQR
jgi:hypothetical protein